MGTGRFLLISFYILTFVVEVLEAAVEAKSEVIASFVGDVVEAFAIVVELILEMELMQFSILPVSVEARLFL